MKEKWEDHVICGHCGGCYFNDVNAAKSCCDTEEKRREIAKPLPGDT